MTAFTQTSTTLGGKIEHFTWNWPEKTLTVVYETIGQGTPVLLLPAFSTVSTRTEMQGIALRLASHYQVFTLDWLGFGQSERLSLNYQPTLYHQLLLDFVESRFNQPIIIIAAGHAAGYALQLANTRPNAVAKIILMAPTWCGPLRVMGAPIGMRKLVQNLVRSPIIGQFLYYLNTTPAFLRFMYRRHVYVDETKLTPEFIARKRQITQQTGARFAPVAFVTGEIDPVTSRSAFLGLVKSLSMPILTIIAEQAPPYSKAEMEALGELSNVETVRLPGTLGMHEEYSEAVAEAILKFL